MHKNATKCNETLYKWCKNKHGASKIIDTFETYHPSLQRQHCVPNMQERRSRPSTCWWRYEESNNNNNGGGEREVNAAYGVDTNWYGDSGATDHITGNLEKLMIRDQYHGKDKIHTANGEGMHISHIGHTSIQTQNCDLHLKNVLHVPSATENLASIHKLTLDNDIFIEFHPWYFLIKDRATENILLKGRCEGGLYPIVSSSSSSPSKQVFVITKPSTSRWHSRLGHPSHLVVDQILNKFCLPHTKESSVDTICDSCQRAKSHQLPYPVSTSVSTIPLQQVFSDVWGPAPTSVGRYKYYVSFIDDFSKYTWIYLIKKKSDVFDVFRNFMNLVERKFNKKIITMQTDWGGEYEKLSPFFQKLGITHHVSCPHAHQQNGSVERKHRHIVEVGLALLAHASMPLKFWDEAFLTATYLINIMPSKVINNATPVELLFETVPDYKNL
jgi:histone deacetylase 1/2